MQCGTVYHYKYSINLDFQIAEIENVRPHIFQDTQTDKQFLLLTNILYMNTELHCLSRSRRLEPPFTSCKWQRNQGVHKEGFSWQSTISRAVELFSTVALCHAANGPSLFQTFQLTPERITALFFAGYLSRCAPIN